jgi:hypothetical protein
MKSATIGFDARDLSERWLARWSEEYRNEWLIRTDIAAPYSIDDEVWPSACGLRESDPGRVVGFVQDLWEDLSALVDFAREHCAGGEYCVAAFTVVLERFWSDGGTEWDQILLPTVPSSLGPEWRPRGYDVADRFLLSALTNCVRHGLDDRDEQRVRFAHLLNDVGLFQDAEAANKLRELSNVRVPEHAPFYVFGVYTWTDSKG